MSKDMNALDKAAVRDEMRLMRIGDRAVALEEIQSSALYKDLASIGAPEELSRILGLHDISVADALQHATRVTARLFEVTRAEVLVAIYKSELRSKGLAEDAIALAVADFQPSPAYAFTPPSLVPPSNDPTTETVTALSAITAGMPVYWDSATGKYGPADSSSAAKADAAGVALDSAAAGGTFRMAIGGKIPLSLITLPGSFTGPYAYVGPSSSPGSYGNSPAASLGLWARPILRLVGAPSTVPSAPTTWVAAYVINRPAAQV